MKLIILKSNLKNALDSISHTVGDNSNLPILKSVLVMADDISISLTSTNLEAAITKKVSGKIIESGSFAVPFSIFNHIVSNIQTEKIELDYSNTSLKIKADNYEATVQVSSSEEYPVIPKINDKSQCLEIEAGVLKDALSKVSFAAQISELKPDISGVLLDLKSSLLKVVATDTFRLAEKVIGESLIKSSFNKDLRVIIPLKSIAEIIRILSGDLPVKVFIVGGQILIESDGLELITRAIDGKFPDYEAIIPKNIETEITIKNIDLINALKLSSSFSSKNNDIRLKIDSENKKIDIYAGDNALGENKYSLSADISGNSLEVSFNWKYLIDGLKNMTGDVSVISLQGSIKPAIIKSVNDNKYFYIIMPLNI